MICSRRRRQALAFRAPQRGVNGDVRELGPAIFICEGHSRPEICAWGAVSERRISRPVGRPAQLLIKDGVCFKGVALSDQAASSSIRPVSAAEGKSAQESVLEEFLHVRRPAVTFQDLAERSRLRVVRC